MGATEAKRETHLESSTTAPASEARIAGYMPTGMLDWPGRMATTVFIAGCNLRCPFCHNPDLMHPASNPDALDSLLRHLHDRRDWVDGVVLTGGEPTLDPAIFCLLDELASLRVPVKLDTNGTRPEVLGTLIESGLLAFIALDVKAIPSRYDDATGTDASWVAIDESIRTIMGCGVPHEFRTTVCPDYVSLEDIPEIAKILSGGNRYALQQFRPERTYSSSVAKTPQYSPDDIRAMAASACEHIPTIVRGV